MEKRAIMLSISLGHDSSMYEGVRRSCLPSMLPGKPRSRMLYRRVTAEMVAVTYSGSPTQMQSSTCVPIKERRDRCMYRQGSTLLGL